MKLFKSFCGAVLIMALFAFMSASATPPGTDTWNSTDNGNHNAEFNADVYCVPTFTVSGSGGTANGQYSYTQYLGNYYLGFVGDVPNLDIVFTLQGPGMLFDGTTPVDYSVSIPHSHTTSLHGASIVAHWAISSANVNWDAGHVGDAFDFPPPYIHLNVDPQNNCNSKATFTITSISIDLRTNWEAGTTLPTTETFSFTLEASANI